MKRAANPMKRGWLDESEGGWIAHRLRLLMSPAWRLRPIPLCRVLERLEIEHLRHGGKENGRLIVSFDQFVAYGISRKIIRPAISTGANLGLLVAIQSEEWVGNIKEPNTYRLTYVPEKDRRAPTDEWAMLTEEEALRYVEAFRKVSSEKSKGRFPLRPAPSSLLGRKEASTGSLSVQTPIPKREPTLISGGNAETAQPLVASPSQTGRVSEEEQASGPVTVGAALATLAIVTKLRRRA